MKPFLHVAAYHFTPLDNLRDRRSELLDLCQAAQLKGTILLSPEGINLFVAGLPDHVASLIDHLRTWPGLATLETKHSHCETQPFRRMLVRLKKEIIAFGVDGIQPGLRTSPKLPAATLRQWLDEGRDLVLLDTRNDYEVKLGTFRNALPIGVNHFRDFPNAVRQLPPEMKDQTIVMFCTGGIRCEKAGPFMENEGFHSVFQLDGGILKYFEDCGGAHYDGECFVFDQRVGLDPALEETHSAQCFHCQSPLTEAETRDPRYQPGSSCPFCFQSPAEQLARTLQKRHDALRQLTSPLPGSIAQDHEKPIHIPGDCDGLPLLDALNHAIRGQHPSYWAEELTHHRILDFQRNPAAPDRRVRAGERYLHLVPAVIEPDVNPDIRILHEDETILVIDKPAPLPLHPGGRFFRNTLQHLLCQIYHPQRPKPVHRLDANTTGILLLARTRHFAGVLQQQFQSRRVGKSYLVRIHGHPQQSEFTCSAPISRESGSLGSRCIDPVDGLPAETRFRVLHHPDPHSSILEAQPITGRTNQIRIHLQHLGFPITGDPTYLADGSLGSTQTLALTDPPLCLHAWRLSFQHPVTKQALEFESPPPTWALPLPSIP